MEYVLAVTAQRIEEAYLADEIDEVHYMNSIEVINHLSLRDSVKKK